MKKYMIRILTVLCLVCFGAAMFVGCKEEQKEPPVEDTQYTVTYAAGGGTGTAPAVEKYKEGDTFKVKENPFSKEGSTFKTWNDGSKDYAPGADYTMPKKNVTFTAQWEENGTVTPATKVTVTYSLGENTTGKAPEAQEVDKGGQVTLPAAPAWEGHTFKGWKVGNDATLKKAGDKITVNENVTVTAQWEVQKEQVTVTFDLGGVPALNEKDPGTAWTTPAAKKVDKDSEYTLPGAPAWWAGHMFTGWKVGDGEVKKAGEKITAAANVKLTAQWEETQSITGVELEVTEDTAFIVVHGMYKGYTDAAMLDMLKNGDQEVLKYSVCIGQEPWTYQEPDVLAEAEDGIYTVKIDVTDFDPQYPYAVTENRNGYGNIRAVAVEDTKTVGGKKYYLHGAVGSDLLLNISDAEKTYDLTDITLEQAESKAYLVFTGTFAGYTEAALKELLEDVNTFFFYGNGSAGNQKPESRTATFADGKWTLKVDITDMPDDIEYAICQVNVNDLKHPKADSTDSTIKVGIRTYTLVAHAWGGWVRLTISTEKGTCAVTGLDLEVDETAKKVYLIATGTFADYTEAELKALFEGTNKMYVHFWGDSAKMETPASTVVTTSEGTWTAKSDVTNLKDDELRNVLINGELKLDIQDKTVVLGEKAYTLQKANGYGNTGLRVGAKFARPSSARLELTPDKGNGTDENFKNDIEKAFFVISGKYYSEVTESEAKTFFSKDKYPFEFGSYNSTKDRIRRISIDTTAHTYTVKFDVSWLPAGEHYCRFGPKGGNDDLRLSKQACPDNTVKSVGSTYTLTNYNGTDDHWGCIVLKVERNYAVTGVTVQEESGKPTLTVSGTFDSAFTPEQIKKFLEDEDIRSMCVDLYGEGWNKVKTVVTTEAGKFTVKIDLSEVANGSYIVAIDASGYGNITMESITGTLSSGGKTYTLSVDGDKNVKLTIA